MTQTIQGIAIGTGVAVGRAVVIASGKSSVEHYFIDPQAVEAEITRVLDARDAAVQEVQHMLAQLPADAPSELPALLEVHMLLLQDEGLFRGVRYWIEERLYNAAWALSNQFERLAKQFDEMEDAYLRERKADLEQVIERIIQRLQGQQSVLPQRRRLDDETNTDTPLVLVAHDLAPADLLNFRQSVFDGFVTDVGGKNSHTAIVARSMKIAAVVGARHATEWVQDDDWIVIDGEAGLVFINPEQSTLDEYKQRQQTKALRDESLQSLLHTPAKTLDGQDIELLANIELPEDAAGAIAAGAAGVGLFRSEFLFMEHKQDLPDEARQYAAYAQAVADMQGLPLTIRTIDVGADKPLEHAATHMHLNPALGLRAIRWSLAEPDMFLTQLRAILRAAQHGQVQLLLPMIAHLDEVRQTQQLLAQARAMLDAENIPYGSVQVGAMVEVPAAALMASTLLQYFDFLSIGTNDLIQYTLAIDRADEAVAHLYDPLNPGVLQLLAMTIQAAQQANKPVSVCGEMAGDTNFTRLLLGLGLRSFSMHPAHILEVKEVILSSDTSKLKDWAQQVVNSTDPAAVLQQIH